MREIVGHLSISSSRGLGGVREVLEAGNVAFKNELNYSIFDSWGYGIGLNWQRFQWPWRLQPGLANNPNLYHGHFGQDTSTYPGNQGSTINSLYDGSHQSASFSPGDSYASSMGSKTCPYHRCQSWLGCNRWRRTLVMEKRKWVCWVLYWWCGYWRAIRWRIIVGILQRTRKRR